MCWAVALVAQAVSLSGQSPPPVLNEYRVKAAYVYRFSQFVTWPPAALAGAATIDICVLRPSPFGGELAQLVRGESVEGRAVRVREVAGADAVAGCHAIFVGADAPGARNVVRAATGHHILTVGESESFLNDGGIIALRVIDRRVRFEVDAANARRAGLRIAAQLLNLAVRVRDGGSS